MKVKIDRQSAAKAITKHEVSKMARRIQQNIINESARRYDMRQRNAALTAANEALADALSRALGGRDRVFLPRRRDDHAEFSVELTIGDDFLIRRRK